MAHFAKLDKNNIVLEVIVINNLELDPANEESSGLAWLENWSGGYTNWKQTSYNGSIRKNYAGIGYTYDEVRDAFISPEPYQHNGLNEKTCTWIPPKPYNSWVLNEDTCNWEAPTPYPSGDGMYQWVEDDLNWQLVESGA
jgi:hypothetical protein